MTYVCVCMLLFSSSPVLEVCTGFWRLLSELSESCLFPQHATQPGVFWVFIKQRLKNEDGWNADTRVYDAWYSSSIFKNLVQFWSKSFYACLNSFLFEKSKVPLFFVVVGRQRWFFTSQAFQKLCSVLGSKPKIFPSNVRLCPSRSYFYSKPTQLFCVFFLFFFKCSKHVWEMR